MPANPSPKRCRRYRSEVDAGLEIQHKLLVSLVMDNGVHFFLHDG